MKKFIPTLLLMGATQILSAAPAVIYDGSVTPGGIAISGARIFTNSGKTWIYAPSSVAAYTVSGGATTLSTGTGGVSSAAEAVAAGFALVGGATLNASAGYTLGINLQTNAESHSGNPASDGPNRAGFSLTLIGSDKTKSIEIGFWGNQIWVQNDAADSDGMFTHGESAAIDTTDGFHRYNVVVQGDTYTIYDGQLFLLTGLLRDYSSSSAGFNGVAVYQTSNFFFMGDNTSSAGGSYSFTDVTFSGTAAYYQLAGDGNQLSMKNVTAAPGASYLAPRFDPFTDMVSLDHTNPQMENRGVWEARNGGSVTGSGNTVENRADGGMGLWASGSGSVIRGTDLTVNAYTYGNRAVVADNDGAVLLNGGTVALGYVDYGQSSVPAGVYVGALAGLTVRTGGRIEAAAVTVVTERIDTYAIDASGGTVSGSNLILAGGRVDVAQQSTVRLTGGSISGTGNIYHDSPISHDSLDFITVSGSSLLELTGVTVSSSGIGHTTLSVTSGTANISGGSITSSGLAVFVNGDDAAVTLQNTAVAGNFYALAINCGSVTVSGGTISGRVFSGSGGATVLQNAQTRGGIQMHGGALTVSGGTLERGTGVATIVANTWLSSTLTISDGATAGTENDLLVSAVNLGYAALDPQTSNIYHPPYTGAITGTLTLTVDNATALGDIISADNAAVVVRLENSAHYRGAVDPADMSISADSRWTVTGDSAVGQLANNGRVEFAGGASVKTLRADTLTGAGAFVINVLDDLSASDRLIVSGSAGGAHELIISNTNATAAGKDLHLEVVYVGADSDATFSGEPELGMFQYKVLLSNSGTVWYVGYVETSGTGDPPDPPVGPTGSVVLGMEGSQALLWFAQLDSLTKRMGELRLGNRADGDWLDNVWLRGYGSQINAGASVSGRGFSVQMYGFDVGTDKTWRLENGHTLTLGGFAGWGRGDHNFRVNGSEGRTDNICGGLYGSWLHRDGWFADVVGKVQSFDSTFTARDEHYRATHADYDNWGLGVSVEFGRQFKFADGWFAEPQLQIAYARLTDSDYRTTGNNVFAVTQNAADVWQFRAGAMLGRTIELKNSGALQPYVKFSGVEQVSSGGRVTASDTTWRPNLDGIRAELGFGLVWQIDDNNQLHLDYEASFGNKYDKPWGINAGYRYQF